MKLSPHKQEEPDVNLTPMIDVVFLLLLFFMVSTSFIRESTINGVVLDEPSPEQLSAQLKQAVGETEDPHVIISADANAEYQNIVTAMDTAQQLGYTRLTLATRQKTKE